MSTSLDEADRSQRTPSREIVCAVLRPDPADPAIRLAATLATRLGLALALVEVQVPVPPIAGAPLAGTPVVPPPLAPADPLTVRAGDPGGVEPPAADLVALADAAGVHPARVDSVTAAPTDGLVELSRAAAVELLVVADHGGGPLKSKLAGNAGREAMRDVACPLVLVPEGVSDDLPDAPAIVCGVTDDTVAAAVAGVAEDLAGRLGGRLRTVHEPDDASAAEALVTTAREERASLIVLGRPEHGAIRSAMSGSVVHDVLAAAALPVVIVPR